MDTTLWVLKWVIAFVTAWFLSLTMAVKCLMALMILDFATGLITAAMAGTLCSETGFKGIGKKSLIVILLLTSKVAEKLSGLSYDLMSIVAMMYCLNELISITENINHAGLWIPPQFMNYLRKAKRLGGWRGKERRLVQEPINIPDRRQNGV
jgi:toxin secretion/phage lysis holin